MYNFYLNIKLLNLLYFFNRTLILLNLLIINSINCLEQVCQEGDADFYVNSKEGPTIKALM